MPQEVPKRPFVVLSLDGGGTRGVLTARILLNIEDYLNRQLGDNQPLGRRVDLIAGTSTGGIIALALGTGRSAREVVEWYEQRIPAIFSNRGWRKAIRSLFAPAHRSMELRRSLDEFFADVRLSDAICDLCVVSVALQTAQPRIYKTDYLKRDLSRLPERMVDVALATTAAPTYFESVCPPVGGGPLIDGGLCANNPVLVAFTDAVQYERPLSMRGRAAPRSDNWRDDVVVVSVGTGRRGAMPYKAERLVCGGKLRWIRPVLEIFSEAQSLTAHLQASFLLGDHYLRINPAIGTGFELDDARAVDGLRASADLDQAATQFIDRHCDAFAILQQASQ